MYSLKSKISRVYADPFVKANVQTNQEKCNT